MSCQSKQTELNRFRKPIEPLPYFERKTNLCLTNTIGRLDAERQTPIWFLNVQLTVITVSKGALVAKVTLLSPQPAQFLQAVNPELMTDYINQSVNELISSSQFLDNFSIPGRFLIFNTGNVQKSWAVEWNWKTIIW